MEIRGFEPLTLGLQSRCSSQLSYIPVPAVAYKLKGRKGHASIQQFCLAECTPLLFPFSQKGGDPAAPSGTTTLLRLHPPYKAYLRQRPPLRVRLPASGTLYSDGVTGGVYKARERIHRIVLICDY